MHLRKCSHPELTLSKPQSDPGLRKVCWDQLAQSRSHWGLSEREQAGVGQGSGGVKIQLRIPKEGLPGQRNEQDSEDDY